MRGVSLRNSLLRPMMEHVTKVFYICSSLLQLTVESSDFSQAENKITVALHNNRTIVCCRFVQFATVVFFSHLEINHVIQQSTEAD